ncbi:multiple sugar ABC transporter permease [Mycoplasma synoviae GX11-T]|nr:sugar ABC transporter permease [Mycoplasmopsis synoviae]MBD5788562.1 multiple sugar ABC transporter permease [Mycoplasmopsis synoviae GX11-T]
MYKKRFFFGMVLPSIIVFIIVILVPTILALGYSFTDWNGRSGKDLKASWIGFKNYVDIFKDSHFASRIGYTFVFSIASLLLVNIIAFALAYVLNSKLIKGRNIFRSFFFIPNIIGGLVIAYIWQSILQGVYYSIYKQEGSFATLNKWSGLLSMTVVYTWQMAGYIMLIYLAALQNVSKTLDEAAQIEGVSKFKRFKSVVIPAVLPALTVSFFLVLSGSFRMFDLNFILTNERPDSSLLAYDIYTTGDINTQYGLAEAKSVIFVILVSIISISQVAISKKFEVQA